MEQEIKIKLLSQEDYQKAIDNLSGLFTTEEQINYYFDTPNHYLKNNHIMLRIRKKGDKNILTLKRGIALENGYFQAEETEVAVSTDEVGLLFNTPALFINYFHSSILTDSVYDQLIYLGCITTVRSKYHGQNFIIEIDKVMFPNGNEDYEIEIETGDPDKARLFISQFLESYHIKYEAQKFTKHERFLTNVE